MIEAAGIPGLSQSVGADIASLKAMEDIDFGSPVYAVTGDATSAYKTPGTDRVFVGVATLSYGVKGGYKSDAGVTTMLAGKGDWVNVLKRGKVLVTASVAVQANAPAFVTTAGAFGTSGTRIGFYRSNAGAGDLVDLEVSPIAPVIA